MVLTGNTWNEQQIATLCQAVLNGIRYMEEQKLIHRDIKPHNILLNEAGEAKLCDFGISAQGPVRRTVIGTPYYLAPEVIQETGYGNACDIWALGISCIELAEYQPPLHDAHPMRVLFMIPLNPPPTLTSPEHWSQEFNSFLFHCLQKDPATRFPASQLLEHPFITQRANLKSLEPYLDDARDLVRSYGNGSLEVALKAAHARGGRGLKEDFDNDVDDSLDLRSIDERAMFGEFSDLDDELSVTYALPPV